MENKERLDVLLSEKKLFPTREKAKEEILNGIVKVNGKIVTKPGEKFNLDSSIEIIGEKLKYVSRAGLKLEKACREWNIDFNQKTVADVGASTGGFSDFCLQNGAKLVYAIDVGTNQLHEAIKSNPKVINLERTDFRKADLSNTNIDIAVCDCSFISLKLLACKFQEILKPQKELVVLIKPQFECGKQIAQKTKGIIKDFVLQENIKNDIINFYKSFNFEFIGCCDSPILGTAGNKEFLAYFVKN